MTQFIVIEGIDGSGTTTQSELLKEYLLGKGRKAIVSPEPSEGIIGRFVRSILQNKDLLNHGNQRFDEQMAYLFAADRYDHLYNQKNGVFKLIEEGYYVISTRYYFSSLAYNGNTLQEWELIETLNHKFPQPDLVIYLDLPVEISLERMKDRSHKEVYENQAKLTKVRENYGKIFANYSGKLLTIDGTKTFDEIHRQIVNNAWQVGNSAINI
jgi:dTMP kinase